MVRLGGPGMYILRNIPGDSHRCTADPLGSIGLRWCLAPLWGSPHGPEELPSSSSRARAPLLLASKNPAARHSSCSTESEKNIRIPVAWWLTGRTDCKECEEEATKVPIDPPPFALLVLLSAKTLIRDREGRGASSPGAARGHT